MNKIPGTLLLVENGLASKAPLILDRESQTLGQSSAADVHIDNKFVSRSHCRIDFANDEYLITDLESKNGTYINGRRLSPNEPYVLKAGDVIDLAVNAVKLRFPPNSGDDNQTVTMTGPTSEIRVDEERREIWLRGNLLEKQLGRLDFDVIWVLYMNRGRVIPYKEIAQTAWPDREDGDYAINEIHQIISRIRNTIEFDSNERKFIKNKKSVGYMLEG